MFWWKMVSETSEVYAIKKEDYGVLILVLVEDGLGGYEKDSKHRLLSVLILVLVEDGLGGKL